MNYFHVYAKFRDSQGKSQERFCFGYELKNLMKIVVEPYNEDRPFWLLGNEIYPSQVERLFIFRSLEKNAENILLPNGKNAMDEENFGYVVDCFLRGKVPNVFGDTTPNFITPVKKEAGDRSISIHAANKIFIAHGRNREQALDLQKYLRETSSLEPVLFEDVKKKFASKTIIELLEYIMDNAAYAFVVATPDDLGYLCKDIEICEKELLIGKTKVKAEDVRKLIAKFKKRARQNVVFELGLFYGVLKRDRVCCLLHVDVQEKPSDIDGILYVPFEKSVEEKFSEIRDKLKEAKMIKE